MTRAGGYMGLLFIKEASATKVSEYVLAIDADAVVVLVFDVAN